MAELLLKAFAAVFAAVVALSGATVSAQTHHVLGGDGGGLGTASDVGSWLSGRVFRVGDKISFNCSGTDDNIVELESPEDFHSCDLTNPIKMYTDPVSQVELEKEGVRYFTSANPENCKNGLKLHVPVQSQEYELHTHEPPFEPFTPHDPPYDPPEPEPEPVKPKPPVEPFPPYDPPYDPPQPVRPPPPYDPPYDPPHPVTPPPPYDPPYDPPQPVTPPPPYDPPYDPPQPVRPPPSAATYLNNLSLVLFVGLLICYVVVM